MEKSIICENETQVLKFAIVVMMSQTAKYFLQFVLQGRWGRKEVDQHADMYQVPASIPQNHTMIMLEPTWWRILEQRGQI